jgi:hypothetical protein
MDYEKDFVMSESVDLDIKDYPKGAFKYKPTTAGEENSWLDKYMIIEDGKPKQDFAMLNKLKLGNLVGVPYSKELLQKLSGNDKAWKDYSVDEKWLVLGKLKGKVFDSILNAINDFDTGASEEKKA